MSAGVNPEKPAVPIGSIRWQWPLSFLQRKFGVSEPVVLVPGAASGYLALAVDELQADDVAEIHIVVRVDPGTSGGFEVTDLELSAPAIAPVP